MTPFIALETGLVLVTMEHKGRRNFIVELVDSSGRTADYLANQIGDFRGEKALGVGGSSFMGPKPGLHILNNHADGDWRITLQYR